MANATATAPAAQQRGGQPDPYTDPASYLQSKGWKCLGNPDWPSAGWLDPSKPLTEEKSEVPVMAPHLVPDGVTPEGKPKFKYEIRQVQVQDGTGVTGQKVPAFRTHIRPKVEPIPMQEALMIQLERDMKADK